MSQLFPTMTAETIGLKSSRGKEGATSVLESSCTNVRNECWPAHRVFQDIPHEIVTQ